jgi:hypothetical protein
MNEMFEYDEEIFRKLETIYAKLVHEKVVGVEVQYLSDYLNFLRTRIRPHVRGQRTVVNISGEVVPLPMQTILETMQEFEEKEPC